MAPFSAHPDELITLPARGVMNGASAKCCTGALMACGSESFTGKDGVRGAVVSTPPPNKEMLRRTLIVQD